MSTKAQKRRELKGIRAIIESRTHFQLGHYTEMYQSIEAKKDSIRITEDSDRLYHALELLRYCDDSMNVAPEIRMINGKMVIDIKTR